MKLEMVDTPTEEKRDSDKLWYVGAMNDGLFVIDAPPRPSTDDITNQPNVNVIAALGTNRDAADLLVKEHNERIALRKQVRSLNDELAK